MRFRILDLFSGAGGAAMGIDWMPWSKLILSIPPAYTEHIGRQIIQQIERNGE